MEISKFLAKVLGIYLLIVSSALFFNIQQFSISVSNLINNSPLMFVTGFFTLILGILMVVSHNIWQWHWRVIITMIAWIVLIKAITILFFPQFIDNISLAFINNIYFAYAAGAIDLILGLFLCYFGFKK